MEFETFETELLLSNQIRACSFVAFNFLPITMIDLRTAYASQSSLLLVENDVTLIDNVLCSHLWKTSGL